MAIEAFEFPKFTMAPIPKIGGGLKVSGGGKDVHARSPCTCREEVGGRPGVGCVDGWRPQVRLTVAALVVGKVGAKVGKERLPTLSVFVVFVLSVNRLFFLFERLGVCRKPSVASARF